MENDTTIFVMGNKKKTTVKKKTTRVTPKAKKSAAKKTTAAKKVRNAKKTTSITKKKQITSKAKSKTSKASFAKTKAPTKLKKTTSKPKKEVKKTVKEKPKTVETTALSGVGAVVGKLKKVVEKAKKISVKDLKKKSEPVKASQRKTIEELDVDLDDDQSGENQEGKSAIEVILTDAEGRQYCRRRDCDQIAMVEGYCRYHYLLFWKKIQQRKKILTDGKLVNYIEELTARYPDKYLDMIKRDLKTEKDFMAAIQELEIDESNNEDSEYDDDNSILDEVRGMSDTHHSRDEDDY